VLGTASRYSMYVLAAPLALALGLHPLAASAFRASAPVCRG
jgi:hypothetical protein